MNNKNIILMFIILISSFLFVTLGFGTYSTNLTITNEVLNVEILESSKTTLELILRMFPLVALWTGIMNIAKESKLLDKFSN